MAKTTDNRRPFLGNDNVAPWVQSFNLGSGKPLDTRFVADKIADLYTDPATMFGGGNGYVYIYDGLQVYVRENQSVYMYAGPYDISDAGVQNGVLETEAKKVANWVKIASKNGVSDSSVSVVEADFDVKKMFIEDAENIGLDVYSKQQIDDKLKNLSIGGDVTVSAESDWNAEEGEPGYIKNKPFGGKAEVLLNESISTSYDGYFLYAYSGSVNKVINVEEGQLYKVTISDGTKDNEFIGTCFKNPAGNSYYITDVPESISASGPPVKYGASWDISISLDSTLIHYRSAVTSSTTVTVKIETLVKKLDSAYLNMTYTKGDSNSLIMPQKTVTDELDKLYSMFESLTAELADLRSRVNTTEDCLFENPTNNHSYVDMGEAGIWATCNVGADKPTDPGLYFSWADVAPKPGDSTGGDNKYKNGSEYTKYNETDGLTTTDLKDDAARTIMGGNWRTPTKEEYQKLIDLCDQEPVNNYNNSGMQGRLFKLKADNSKELFFPFAGGYVDYSSYFGSEGNYWTSSINEFSYTKANSLHIEWGYSGLYSEERSDQMSIRAFMDPTERNEKYVTKKEFERRFQVMGVDEYNAITDKEEDAFYFIKD